MEPTYIKILDTTLGAGLNMPSMTASMGGLLQIARELTLLNVDIIELGSPFQPPNVEMLEAIESTANSRTGPVIAIPSCCTADSIRKTANALENAARPRINLQCLRTRVHRLPRQMAADKRKKALSAVIDSIRRARDLVNDVQLSFEHWSLDKKFEFRKPDMRDLPFLCDLFQAAMEEGVSTICIPDDDMGRMTPEAFGQLVTEIKQRVPGIANIALAVRCYNNYSYALANSMAAARAGVTQIECTVNGVGVRAGITGLETVAAEPEFGYDEARYKTGLNEQRIFSASHAVSFLTSTPVPDNQPVVGRNILTHQIRCGLGYDTEQGNPAVFSDPKKLNWGGLHPSQEFSAGRILRPTGLQSFLKELGYDLDVQEIGRVYERVKRLSQRFNIFRPQSIDTIVRHTIGPKPATWELVALKVSGNSGSVPTTTVCLWNVAAETEVTLSSTINDPKRASFNCINQITGIHSAIVGQHEIMEIQTRRTWHTAHVELARPKKINRFYGQGFSSNLVEAYALAYLDAVNQIIADRSKEESGSAGP